MENKIKIDTSTAYECDVVIFRPSEHPDLCQLYVDGHHKVLEDHGLGFLTSKEDYWCTLNDGYALLALKDGNPLGGVRLERKVFGVDLPLERALKSQKQIVTDYLSKLPYTKMYEACGLWNSREIAGNDLAIFLSRAAIAITISTGIETVLSLNGVYTYRIPRELGLRMVTEIGDNGFFKYPIERFHSALWIHEDLDTLRYASIQARKRILSLRSKPNQTFLEKNQKSGILITYKSKL